MYLTHLNDKDITIYNKNKSVCSHGPTAPVLGNATPMLFVNMTGIIFSKTTDRNRLKKKLWFWLGPSRLICTFQFQLKRKEQMLGAGVSIHAIVQRMGDGKKWLILKEQCALFTQLQPPSITSPFLSYFLSLVPLHPPTTHPPTLPCSLAPAERLTRAHEKGSSVKGQC